MKAVVVGCLSLSTGFLTLNASAQDIVIIGGTSYSCPTRCIVENIPNVPGGVRVTDCERWRSQSSCRIANGACDAGTSTTARCTEKSSEVK